jgi:hypothetical protein
MILLRLGKLMMLSSQLHESYNVSDRWPGLSRQRRDYRLL